MHSSRKNIAFLRLLEPFPESRDTCLADEDLFVGRGSELEHHASAKPQADAGNRLVGHYILAVGAEELAGIELLGQFVECLLEEEGFTVTVRFRKSEAIMGT